jgi:hypothetical protein
MNLIKTYYKLPVSNIPFNEIPSLELISHDYIYCSSFPLIGFMGLDFYLISVYNAFDNQIVDLSELSDKELLFGKVVSEKLPTRGKYNCLKINSVEQEVSATTLPDFKYSPGNTYSSGGKWFYMKEGNYVILSGIKSEFERVKHLEGISIYGENIIRLRIVMELLKKNVKQGKLKLSIEDYKNIAYKVLRSDPALSRADEGMLKDGVNNWVSPILSTPLYEDIPKNIRGKVVV